MLRAPDLSGRALDGRYELHELIGEGAFGRVYSGRDRRLERAVAVKVIKPWWAEDGDWVERFEREAQLLARVSDPGIVQIFDIGRAEEGPYYVAELVHGQSLAEQLRRGPLPLHQARDIGEQLARALASAHAQGVVHCDVKPANVLLADGARVKVGDFGVARLAGGTSQPLSATVAGTPRYMSPEQARGRPTTTATDVYSAGVVIYEMLAGQPPFEHGSAVELGLRHLQEQPPRLPARVPRALREVVMRALAKDPRERYRDGAALADALHELEPEADSADRVSDRPHGPSAPSARSRPPSRGGGAGAAAVLDPPPTAPALATTAAAPAAARASAPTRPLGSERPASLAATSVLANGSAAPPAHSPRRSHAPSRRRRLRLLALALALASGALAVLLLAGAAAHTTVPQLRGLPRGGVEARARRLHLRPAFYERYSEAAPGIAIAQQPAAGTRDTDGSTVRVALSAGPPPVTVPGVVGQSAASAESRLTAAGLRYGVTLAAAPGSPSGSVLSQAPASQASAPRGSTVSLRVAEAPRWRALTTFSGVNDGQSVAFRTLGRRFRVLYSMSYEGTCTLLLVCFGPSAEVHNLQSGASFGSFELNEGEAQTHTFGDGPGLYRMVVSGGHDSARWSMTVEDYY